MEYSIYFLCTTIALYLGARWCHDVANECIERKDYRRSLRLLRYCKALLVLGVVFLVACVVAVIRWDMARQNTDVRTGCVYPATIVANAEQPAAEVGLMVLNG